MRTSSRRRLVDSGSKSKRNACVRVLHSSRCNSESFSSSTVNFRPSPFKMSSTGAQRRPAGLSLHRFDPPSSAGASSSKRDSQSITGGATALLTGMGGASSVSSAAGGSGGAGAAGAGAGEGKRKDVEGITSPGELTVFVSQRNFNISLKYRTLTDAHLLCSPS